MVKEGILALGVLLGFGYIVYAKLVQNNPRFAKTMSNIMPKGIYHESKIKPSGGMSGGVPLEERRGMM